MKNASPIKYDIKNTGYYCVLTDKFTAGNYEAVVEFRNAYGELPATQIPKLPFYGGITLLYFFVAVYWGFLYYQHHSDICKLSTLLCKAIVKCLLTVPFSGGPELHNSNSDLPRGRNANDMGLLWYVYPEVIGNSAADVRSRLPEQERLQRRV